MHKFKDYSFAALATAVDDNFEASLVAKEVEARLQVFSFIEEVFKLPTFSFLSGPPGTPILDQGAGARKGEEEGAEGVPDEEAEVQLHNQHTLLHQSQPETEIGPKTSTNPSPKLI